MSSKTEQLYLSERASTGDKEAIEALYTSTVPQLRRYLLQRFRDDERLLGYVDDAIQTVWVDLLVKNSFRKFTGKSLFYTFLAPYAVWAVLKLSRGYGRANDLPLSLEERTATGAEPAYIDESFEQGEAYKNFFDVWRRLPRQEKALFLEERRSGRRTSKYQAVAGRLRAAMLGEEWEEPVVCPVVNRCSHERHLASQYQKQQREAHRLTDEQLEEIKQRLMDRESVDVLSSEYRLTRTTLYKILVGTFTVAA